MASLLTRSGRVAAALAASTFLAPIVLLDPAHADGRRHHGDWAADRYSPPHGGYGEPWHYRSAYGVDRRAQARHLRRACRAAIRREADYIGFHEVDFDSRGRIEQTGPRRFRVWFGEVEFEGRRREVERGSGCEIVRGDVVFVSGVPRPRRPHYWRWHDHD